jgi:hypothetical protein
MTGKFLIDLTDSRFHIAENEDVLEVVRRANPFAHSDVGSLLLDLGKQIPGARAYSPSYASYAYVVLHTDAWRINPWDPHTPAADQRARLARVTSNAILRVRCE